PVPLPACSCALPVFSSVVRVATPTYGPGPPRGRSGRPRPRPERVPPPVGTGAAHPRSHVPRPVPAPRPAARRAGAAGRRGDTAPGASAGAPGADARARAARGAAVGARPGQVRRDDHVGGVAVGALVEGAAAGDQAQLGPAVPAGPVGLLGVEAVPLQDLDALDGELGDLVVRADHPDLLAGLQRAHPVEDGGPGLGVDVTHHQGGAGRPRRHPVRVPADRARPVERRRVERAARVEAAGDDRGVDVEARDLQAFGQRLVQRPVRGRKFHLRRAAGGGHVTGGGPGRPGPRVRRVAPPQPQPEQQHHPGHTGEQPARAGRGGGLFGSGHGQPVPRLRRARPRATATAAAPASARPVTTCAVPGPSPDSAAASRAVPPPPASTGATGEAGAVGRSVAGSSWPPDGLRAGATVMVPLRSVSPQLTFTSYTPAVTVDRTRLSPTRTPSDTLSRTSETNAADTATAVRSAHSATRRVTSVPGAGAAGVTATPPPSAAYAVAGVSAA